MRGNAMMIKRFLPDSQTALSTQVFFLLDMTGSMGENKAATIDAFNEYVGSLKSDDTTSGLKFSLAIFNSAIGIGLNIDKESLSDVPKLNNMNYVPNGTTPLYDAIGFSIDSLDGAEGSVLFIVLTDGYENSSTRFVKHDITQKISRKTEQDWKFVFLGCDIDAMQDGADIGISPESAKSYSRDESSLALGEMADATIRYAKRDRVARKEVGFFKK